VGLLTVLAVVLGIVSVADHLAIKPILPSRGSMYGHWSVTTLILATCVSLLFATMRIPLRWDRAGAWCSHLGLILLACGSILFWRTRTEGYCAFASPGSARPPLKYFFQATDKMAFHVYDRDLMRKSAMDKRRQLPVTIQTVLDSPDGIEPLELDVPIDGGPKDVSMRAVKLYPYAELEDRWSNDSPNAAPAIELQLSHGRDVRQVTISPAYRDTSGFMTEEFDVFFRAEDPPSQERIDAHNAKPPATQPVREQFMIHYDGVTQPVLVGRDARGKMQRRDFGPGQSVETSHPDHPVRIDVLRTMNHARRGIQLTPVRRGDRDDETRAAIEIEVKVDSWKVRRIVPFAHYLTGSPTWIGLPQDRSVIVAFSNYRLDLPEQIGITAYEFKTAPVSGMAEDYICEVEIGRGIYTRNETLKLNYPVSIGQYRLYQANWEWDRDNPHATGPSMIILGVGDRPGIALIFVGGFMICLGFPYAFYVKPLILRARARGES